MKGRITAYKLKRKYSHPRMACEATGAYVPWEYCVGGALCMEVVGEKGMHFPDFERLMAAVLAANPRIDKYAMADPEYNAFRSTLSEVEARNDIGDFTGAWLALERLLNWPGKNLRS